MKRGFEQCHNQAYSIGRTEILDWVNSLLGLNYTKIEQCANGAAICQIFDAIYPGIIKLCKVKFEAISEPDMVGNYKVLQELFNKKNIQRQVPVDILIKGKPMASLEMMQWVYSYFKQNYSGNQYDPVVSREFSTISSKKSTKTPLLSTKSSIPRPTSANKPKHINDIDVLLQKIANLERENEEMKAENQTLLEERNFYFEKLQKIENLCQGKSSDSFSNEVLTILYETDEEHGFVHPDELDI